MLRTTRCQHCRHEFALSLERCPHCARPGLFPNVSMAEMAEERQALGRRYDHALANAVSRGVESMVRDFETAASRTVAVIARSFQQTQALAAGDDQGYATYYQQTMAETRFPTGNEWDSLRRVADAALFSGYEKHVRFAALSLDGRGSAKYGECSWVLREDMIAHRASVFEENSTIFMEHHDVRVSQANELPRGYRATWAERSRLCVAKLAANIDRKTKTADFPRLLLCPSKTGPDDDFVEVHIGGPMTARTLERVIVTKGSKRHRNAIAKALQEKLEELSVTLER